MSEQSAFPHGPTYNLFGKEVDDFNPGMTLRDWFAGQAILSLVIHDTEEARAYSDVARMAYEQADAMLVEREVQA